MSHHDHALPLKGSTYGPQYAGWTPTAFAMQGLGNRTLLDQFVDVGDSVRLHADVYLPKVKGRYPAVVCFAGYSTEGHTAGLPTGTNEIGSPPVFTDRGYCPVVVERRGMGRSTGEQVVFFDPQDVDDHEKVIAWAAEQPWCNGDVVLFGTSYYGMVQPLVAARRPPALRAFFANELCTAIRKMTENGQLPPVPEEYEGRSAQEILDSLTARIRRKLEGGGEGAIRYSSIAERLDQLRQRVIATAEDSIDFLTTLFGVATDLKTTEREDEDGGVLTDLPDPRVGMLTRIFEEHKPDGMIVLVSQVVTEVDALVRHIDNPHWTSKEASKKGASDMSVGVFGVP
ncbi:CocE/NonD family hydrolase [Microbacterium sp.]|uniref:CocE/NonD family hydrolase n=1 Tax=Microbacterium sp. TaxID=51671 RepID=UPI0025DD5504|nr:CocE/NonD family hydrolase [Microbacterium sp.]